MRRRGWLGVGRGQAREAREAREAGSPELGCFLLKRKTRPWADPTARKPILWEGRLHLLEVDYTFQDTRGP